jgi:hypothetical protein
MLTGFSLSLPLIGTPGHLDGCRVGEMDAETKHPTRNESIYNPWRLSSS